jgi:hypothetical protein
MAENGLERRSLMPHVRQRKLDRRRVGRSALVPFVPGEDPMMRHARRLKANLEAEPTVRAWAAEMGWVLKVHNSGQHWIFKKSKRFVEWWPSSAKLVVDKSWDEGIHCHDYLQVKKIIMEIEGLKEAHDGQGNA